MIFTVATMIALALPARAASIWVEGEDAAEKHVSKHVWYDAVHKDGMSGGDWISHFDGKPGTASYKFDVPEAGAYTFWWRGNAFAAKVSYQLNGAAPVEIGFADKRGEYQISEKPDLRFLAWVKVGKVSLLKGRELDHLHIPQRQQQPRRHGLLPLRQQRIRSVWHVEARKRHGRLAGVSQDQPAGPDEAIWIEGEEPLKSMSQARMV